MRYQRAGVLLSLALAGQACGSSAALAPPTGAEGTVAGSYDVRSVNDAPVPVLLPSFRGCAMTGLSGNVSLLPDGRFSGRYRYRRQCPRLTEEIDRGIAGRYSVTGDRIVLAADSGFSKFASVPIVTGTVRNGTLAVQATPTPGTTVAMVLRRR